jgi:hypothetical protein
MPKLCLNLSCTCRVASYSSVITVGCRIATWASKTCIHRSCNSTCTVPTLLVKLPVTLLHGTVAAAALFAIQQSADSALTLPPLVLLPASAFEHSAAGT